MTLDTAAASSTDPVPIEVLGQAPANATDLRPFVFALFFIFGGITSLNDIVIPKLKGLFTLSYGEVMLIQSAFFTAYLLISLPAAAIVRRLGYMRTAVIGLLLMTAGCLLFIPASASALFVIFLAALFVLAAGITIVQVVANPLISMLGSPATAHSRLTFAQAFNSLGTTIFPYIGSILILGSLVSVDPSRLAGAALDAFRTQETHVVVRAYLALASVLILLAALVWLLRNRLVETKNTSSLMHSTYSAFALVPLTFDAKINMLTANATMPSPYDSSLVSSTNANAEYYGGPYEVYVSGISADGVPTSSDLSAQQGFFVQPYVYTANSVLSSPQQTSRLALSNVTISAGSFPPDALRRLDFVGNNTVTGSDVTIASSSIDGTLILEGGQTTLNAVTGGAVVATNANVILQHSDLSSLKLGSGATASIDPSSTFHTLTPALPVLTISSPVANSSYTGTVNAQVIIAGSGVAVLSFILDGEQLPSLLEGAAPGLQVSYPLNTTSLPDGTHTLTVVAVQSDLLKTNASALRHAQPTGGGHEQPRDGQHDD